MPSSIATNPIACSLSSYNWCSSTDAQVGINFSLLQDLANGMDSLNEEGNEADKVQQRLRVLRWSIHGSGMGKDKDEVATYT